MKVYNCEQGSPEWFAVRAGIPTASMFGTVMASGRGGGESATRRKYMLTLIGERITGVCAEGPTNIHMERGKAMEDEARAYYELRTGIETTTVGFIRNGDMGASPDGLVGADGGLEIKTKLPHLQLDCLLKKQLPAEHKAQVHGQIMVSEREWFDFASYWPRLPLMVVRVYRDEEYIKKLQSAVNQFLDETSELENQIRAEYGIPQELSL